MKLNLSSILAAGLALTTLSASADNEFKINGFINVIGGISDSETTYLDDITDNGSFEDTNLGIVISRKINSKVSVATQFHGKHEVFNFDWGYVNYKINSELTAKAGKIKYPGNLFSEIIDIGITFPWVRAPASVYGEAARLSYESYTGSSLFYVGGDDIEYTAEVFLGETDGETAVNERMLGLVLSASTDNIRTQFSFNNSIMVLNDFNPSNPNQVLMQNKSMDSLALGIKAEYDIVTVMAEYANTSMPQNLDITGWYVTLMRSFDKWTPHVTYQSYEGMFGSDETSFTLGLNKQLDVSTVIKFELQSVDPTNSGFFEEQPDSTPVTMFNIALNMVF